MLSPQLQAGCSPSSQNQRSSPTEAATTGGGRTTAGGGGNGGTTTGACGAACAAAGAACGIASATTPSLALPAALGADAAGVAAAAARLSALFLFFACAFVNPSALRTGGALTATAGIAAAGAVPPVPAALPLLLLPTAAFCVPPVPLLAPVAADTGACMLRADAGAALGACCCCCADKLVLLCFLAGFTLCLVFGERTHRCTLCQ